MNTWESELTASIESKNEAQAISIFAEGFPINFRLHMKDIRGNIYLGHTTPLHAACEYKLFELIQYLLASGAQIESTDFEGRTPLLLAAELGSLDVIRSLIDSGSNINQVDFEGNSILHLAVINVHIETVEFLIKTIRI